MSKKVWKNGQIMNEEEASVGIFAHALHYGSSFFEGIRMYECDNHTSAIFQLRAHYERFINSAKIYRTAVGYTVDELIEATLQVIKANEFKSCYIRPLVYRGVGALGVDPRQCPVEVAILAWEWGAYKGEEALEKGLHVQISTWRRPAHNTFPTFAKAGGNYLNSQLIAMEAAENGYDEGLALNTEGLVSEGSGENVFFVKDQIVYTPSLASSALNGITRNAILQIAQDLGYTVKEQDIPRDFVYTVDEAFFTGTAAEMSPIVSVDRIQIGDGKRGPITAHIQQVFFDILKGKNHSHPDWLTLVKTS